jgi:hypothetical protein
MPKLIKLYHPCEIDSINNTNKFLSFTRNLLMTICNKGYQEKKDGILVPVKWSKHRRQWVVDRGTNLERDKKGISLDTLNNYFKDDSPLYTAIVYILNAVNQNEDFYMLGNKLNLVKNSNKFIAFEFVKQDSNKVYLSPLGIYTKDRLNNNKHAVLLDNTPQTMSEFVDVLNVNAIVANKKTKYNYRDLYKEFLTEINTSLFTLVDKQNRKITISIKEQLERNLALPCIFKLKEQSKIIKNETRVYICDDVVGKALNMQLNVLLGDFVKRKVSVEEIEGIVVFDKILNKQLKLTGRNLLIDKFSYDRSLTKSKKEYNNECLLPKVF